MTRCGAWRYPGHQSWDCELKSLHGQQCLLESGHVGSHRLRCGLEAGHRGDCSSDNDFSAEVLCTLSRCSENVYEANCSVVTNVDEWPELRDMIPTGWSAIVDAENDLVAIVPPSYTISYNIGSTDQVDSRRRAMILMSILNWMQQEGSC